MRLTTVTLVAGVLALAVPRSAVAQPAAPLTQAAIAAAAAWKPSITLFPAQKPAPKPPSIDWNRRPSADQPPTAQPSVVCGMTLVPADPTFDAKMRVEAPDRGVAFTMRAVQPTICQK